MKDYPYDATYDPPIPICDVTLMVPATGRYAELSAMVDTGADGTIVPIRYRRRIGARRAFEATLRSQWGEGRTVFLYVVYLTIGALTLNGVYVLGDELGDETVLGRNVLNWLRVLLDGPRAVMTLLDAFHLDSSSVTDPICRWPGREYDASHRQGGAEWAQSRRWRYARIFSIQLDSPSMI